MRFICVKPPSYMVWFEKLLSKVFGLEAGMMCCHRSGHCEVFA